MNKSVAKALALFCVSGLLVTLGPPASASVPIENDNQYKAQISFFKASLDELGAVTPDQAVHLWVKGDETRNGVFKYAVASQTLKQRLADRWGDPVNNFWIIGGSSPWLSDYELVKRVVISPSRIRYVVKYLWKTSAGPETPTVEQLDVTLYRQYWSIDKVIPLSGFQNY